MTVYMLNTTLFHETGKRERKAKLKLLTYYAKKVHITNNWYKEAERVCKCGIS